MKEFLYSSLGLSLMIAGFIFIASFSASLSPRARSQESAPPPTDMPLPMELPPGAPGNAAPPMPSEVGAPTEGLPPELAVPNSAGPDPMSEAPVSTRQDPFIPLVSPQKSVPQTTTTAEPQVTTQTESATFTNDGQLLSDDFFDPNDPWKAYAFKDYALLGILWNVSHPKALFKTPEGRTITVKRKSILGREGSVVVAIRESEVIFLQPGPGGDYEKGTVKILSMRK